ncbi:hypothetical protein HK100_004818 [Physocladia obscura]|uniref:Uncharacterized protein n=1 Tax=Physocladia obscura TaxID=109957 RepID=A0AAD5XGL6_9FUNG|nr:hypothetical protein HK100_004818 [Physocladia obscura]
MAGDSRSLQNQLRKYINEDDFQKEFSALRFLTWYTNGWSNPSHRFLSIWLPQLYSAIVLSQPFKGRPFLDAGFSPIGVKLRRQIVAVSSLCAEAPFCAIANAGYGNIFTGAIMDGKSMKLRPKDLSEKECSAMQIVASATTIPATCTVQYRVKCVKNYGKKGLQQIAMLCAFYAMNNTINELLCLDINREMEIYAEKVFAGTGWNIGLHRISFKVQEQQSDEDFFLQPRKSRNNLKSLEEIAALQAQDKIHKDSQLTSPNTRIVSIDTTKLSQKAASVKSHEDLEKGSSNSSALAAEIQLKSTAASLKSFTASLKSAVISISGGEEYYLPPVGSFRRRKSKSQDNLASFGNFQGLSLDAQKALKDIPVPKTNKAENSHSKLQQASSNQKIATENILTENLTESAIFAMPIIKRSSLKRTTSDKQPQSSVVAIIQPVLEYEQVAVSSSTIQLESTRASMAKVTVNESHQNDSITPQFIIQNIPAYKESPSRLSVADPKIYRKASSIRVSRNSRSQMFEVETNFGDGTAQTSNLKTSLPRVKTLAAEERNSISNSLIPDQAHFAKMLQDSKKVTAANLKQTYLKAKSFTFENTDPLKDFLSVSQILALKVATRNVEHYAISPKLYKASNKNPWATMEVVSLLGVFTLLHRYTAIMDDEIGLEPEVRLMVDSDYGNGLGLKKLSVKDFLINIAKIDRGKSAKTKNIDVGFEIWGGNVEF